ncbi:class I SAM-dependent methyltransferase [Anaeroselena agilis]|uniref:Class I SAM-dependent methyltransferase n=1 Tax=Anaeroselena agilis TaxID=3063788 RepID=A0ABU3P2R3_9FIRM|nr:class I SAM-dependent methyltransferase [Selenomonadales bacterium 4137-cl]
MNDNKTSQAAIHYDENVHKTIPRYHTFHAEVLDLVRVLAPSPRSWLDTGCGTGTLIARAAESFTNTRFLAADPSEAMLELAREKLAALPVDYNQCGSENLAYTDCFDVVTAVMAHHYLSPAQRAQATRKCCEGLRAGGLYITFETIRPLSERGVQVGLQRWRAHQLNSGKAPAEVEKHISRYGSELLPITIAEHLALLEGSGFSAAELFWASGLQAGFYAVKRPTPPSGTY